MPRFSANKRPDRRTGRQGATAVRAARSGLNPLPLAPEWLIDDGWVSPIARPRETQVQPGCGRQ